MIVVLCAYVNYEIILKNIKNKYRVEKYIMPIKLYWFTFVKKILIDKINVILLILKVLLI